MNPPYHRLLWDHDIVLNGIDFASHEANTLFRGVAFEMLRDWRALDLLESFIVKLKYFLILAPPEFGKGFRTYEFGLRAAMLILALAGLFWTQKRILAWLFGGIIVYQAAIHAPLLYTHRYAVLFEALMVPFVGIALVMICKSLTKLGPETSRAAVLIFIVAIGVILNQNIRQHGTQLLQNSLRFPHEQLLDVSGKQLGSNKMFGMERAGESRFRIKAGKAGLVLPAMTHQPGPGRPVVASARIAVNPPAGEACLPAILTYVPANAGRRVRTRHASKFTIQEGDTSEWHNFGVSWLEHMRGQLLLYFRCPVGTEIRFTEFQLLESRVAEVYRDRYLGKRDRGYD